MFSTVKGKLWLVVTALTGALLVLGIYSYSAINTVKVGGPLYQNIVDSMNVRADILPPPQYLIETELTVYQLADAVAAGASAGAYQRAESKLIDLRKQFEDGQISWAKQLPKDTELNNQIRSSLLDRNAKLSRAYFLLVFGRFLPAAKAGDQAAISAILRGPMAKTAELHRAAIDDLTALTDKSSQTGEVTAQRIVASRLRWAIVLLATLAILAFAVAYITIRSITIPLESAVIALDRFAEGDLTVSAATNASGELGKMCHALNRAIESLRGVITKTVTSASHMSQFSKTLSSVSVSVSSGVNEQVKALKDTASQLSSISEMSSSNSSGTREGLESALRTRGAADAGADASKAAVSGMLEIQQASNQIAEIVDAVDEISFHTNLLAVNAAVEAARAGEHGRGFMVVAQEIRSLAQRTAKASSKIRHFVEQAQVAISSGSAKVEQSGASFTSVSLAVRELSAIMEDVGSSINVQTESLKQLNESVAEVSRAIDQSNLGTEQIGSTSRELAAEAYAIHQTVGFFKFADY